MTASSFQEPGRDCPLCERLVAFRLQARAKHPDWHNAPVASWGSASARLLIAGLAPGMQGANRTGRPFTGDWAGDLLYETLGDFGFATGTYDERPDDGLELVDCRITNSVRCVPPENKPIGSEIAACRPFLTNTVKEMPNLKVILALGKIGHDSVVTALGRKPAHVPFAHHARHDLGGLMLVDSYHCSRYNTNTGRLTAAMFKTVFASVRKYLAS